MHLLKLSLSALLLASTANAAITCLDRAAEHQGVSTRFSYSSDLKQFSVEELNSHKVSIKNGLLVGVDGTPVSAKDGKELNIVMATGGDTFIFEETKGIKQASVETAFKKLNLKILMPGKASIANGVIKEFSNQSGTYTADIEELYLSFKILVEKGVKFTDATIRFNANLTKLNFTSIYFPVADFMKLEDNDVLGKTAIEFIAGSFYKSTNSTHNATAAIAIWAEVASDRFDKELFALIEQPLLNDPIVQKEFIYLLRGSKTKHRGGLVSKSFIFDHILLNKPEYFSYILKSNQYNYDPNNISLSKNIAIHFAYTFFRKVSTELKTAKTSFLNNHLGDLYAVYNNILRDPTHPIHKNPSGKDMVNSLIDIIEENMSRQ